MKTKNWLMAFFTIGLLAFAGCSKEVTRTGDTMDVNGVQVDLPKMEKVFATATEEQRAAMTAIQSGVRYGQYTTALMELEKLKADTTLNPEQKAVVDNVFEQLKQVAAKAPAPQQ